MAIIINISSINIVNIIIKWSKRLNLLKIMLILLLLLPYYINSESSCFYEVNILQSYIKASGIIIIICISLLLATKLINVQVPFIFKSIVDSFEHHTINNSVSIMNVLTNSNVETTPIADMITTVSPMTLVLLYGISRSAAAGASELKVI
jgi:hypothetical protein